MTCMRIINTSSLLTELDTPYFDLISTRRMEEYRRKEKSEPELPAPADNEIRCSANGKINRYVEVAIQMLKEQGKQNIVVVGKGATVQKAVTVVEIVKRRLEGTLHQYTQLGSVSTNEHWDPVKGKELDRITVEKKQPVIIVHLSLAAIPDLEGTSGYQAPTGNDIYTS